MNCSQMKVIMFMPFMSHVSRLKPLRQHSFSARERTHRICNHGSYNEGDEGDESNEGDESEGYESNEGGVRKKPCLNRGQGGPKSGKHILRRVPR